MRYGQISVRWESEARRTAQEKNIRGEQQAPVPDLGSRHLCPTLTEQSGRATLFVMSIYPRSESALALGRIHWYLSAANRELWKRAMISVPVSPNIGSRFSIIRSQRTPFGQEVGTDEIRWWITKREQHFSELDLETRKTIPAVEKIIVAIKGFDCTIVLGYKSLVVALEKLTDTVIEEIFVLLRYVTMLKRRDLLAPSMLLAHKIWHSTPLADRRIDVMATDFDSEPESTQQRIIECVYGIRMQRGINFRRLESVIATEEKGNSLDRADVLAATVGVQDEMLYYFRALRSCLENILDEIEILNDLETSVHSTEFWREIINRAVQTNTVEPELWDFKEILDYWRTGHSESEKAKFKLATDMASFANNKGGALIVGVTDGPTRRITGIPFSGKDLENKLKSISQILETYLEHGKILYEICQVDVESKLCIVIAIAQSQEVIEVRAQSGFYAYPFRRIAESVPIRQKEILEMKRNVVRDNYQFVRLLRSRLL